MPQLPISMVSELFTENDFSLDQARTFLKLLDPNAQKFLFVLINPNRHETPKIAYVEPEIAFPDLITMNKEGYGVYVNINETQGKGRRKEDITRCRAAFIEDDNKSLAKALPIQPSITIESSPGKHHKYFLTSTTDQKTYEQVQQTLVNEYGGDPNARDISRILRVPGFYNTKRDYQVMPRIRLLDTNGIRYDWRSIVAAFPPSPVVRPDGTFKGAPVDVNANWHLFLTGEDYHRAGISLIGYYYNSGVTDREKLITLMQSQMEVLGNQSDPRYLHRRDKDIPASVDWVLHERAAAAPAAPQVEFKEEKRKTDHVPWPPGLLGQMCREINEMAHHPNQSIAVVAGVAVVAGIIGRTYNVRGTGLNMFISLLANTGVGKELITRAVNHAFLDGYVGEGAASFRGPGRFTGPPGIIKSLQGGMSQICVMTEAGLLNASKAGDGSGVTRTLLSLYTRSGKKDWTQTEVYSKDEDSIPALNAPALSIIAESTPQTFIQGFLSSKADVNGEMARTWIVRLHGDKEPLQRDIRKGFSKTVNERLKEVIAICSSNQLTPTPQAVYDVEVPEQVYADSDKMTDRENEFRRAGKLFEQATTSRAWIKQVKLSSICSIFNNPRELKIEYHSYMWACSVVEKEITEIHDSLMHESSSDLTAVISGIVIPAIYRILHDGFKTKKKKVSKELRKLSIVTRSTLGQALLNNRTLKELDGDASKGKASTGLDKVLAYMCETGLLRKVEKTELLGLGSKASLGYQITDDMVAAYSD